MAAKAPRPERVHPIALPTAAHDTPKTVLAVDIGGSLAKLAFYSSGSHDKLSGAALLPAGVPAGDAHASEEQSDATGRITFMKFETKNMRACLDYIKKHLLSGDVKPDCVQATGGGAHKFRDLWERELGLPMRKQDELECLVRGCNFVLRNVPNEAYSYDENREPAYEYSTSDEPVYPYLLCNVGSGVSILRVNSAVEYERVGGTSLGGGTLWGLCALLTDCETFDEILELCESGGTCVW